MILKKKVMKTLSGIMASTMTDNMIRMMANNPRMLQMIIQHREIVASDGHLDKIINIIRENGRPGFEGDGMIIISPLDEVYKVRTDETGNLAI
jgi:nitrogen regulatory protein PII